MDRHNSSNQWTAAERSALNQISDSVEKLIRVPLNGLDKNDGEFDLYYFVHTAEGERTAKSVLFCAGGPGEIVRTLDRADTYADFLCKYGYNVVFFHLRGTGFSQIPAGNENDKFLRSTFAVQDMEFIRQDFLGKRFGDPNMPWEAIIGWSFGTVLAQLYAERYHLRKLVKKLVLISPLSRHMFTNPSKSAYDDYYEKMLRIYRDTLDRIFTSRKEALANEFGDLEKNEKDAILDKLFKLDTGILRKTEEAFGSIQSLIDAYSDIEAKTFEQFELRKYSQRFYQSLRDIRIVGANAIDDSGIIEQQRLIGKTLRDELLPKRDPQHDESAADNSDQGSQRAYYSFGIRDGLNWVFLREYCDRSHSIEASVKAVGGKADIDHRSLKKVKIEELLERTNWDEAKRITPWDPADHDHDVSTLILNGELDPVTAGGQAERYLESKLRGDRTLIVFPSVGHAISLGAIFETFQPKQPPILSGAIRVNLKESIPPGKIFETKGSATGLELNPNLRLDLDKPEELKSPIEIHGCGVLRDEYLEKDKRLNIIALVENKDTTDVQVRDYNWCLYTRILRGTVNFVEPPTIAPKDTCAIFGRLIHGEKNQDYAYEINPVSPKDVDDGLELVGYNLKEGGSLELWFRNASGKPIEGPVVIPWTIKNVKSPRFMFRVTIPTLKEHQIISLLVAVDGLNFDPTEVLAINPPEQAAGELTACFDIKSRNSDKLSLIVWNKGQKSKQIAEGWSISCPVFSASVELERTEIEPNSIKTVAADVTGIALVKCLEIKHPPSEQDPNLQWDPNLQLLSFNIQEPNSVSMLFKNMGDNQSVPACYDWKYVDPRVNGNDPAIDRALNCLIFSFLVVSPSQFAIRNDNDILKTIQDKFDSPLGLTSTALRQSENVENTTNSYQGIPLARST